MDLAMELTVVMLLVIACLPSIGALPPVNMPRFVVEPSDIVVQTGHTARLECEVSSLAGSQAVAWMKEQGISAKNLDEFPATVNSSTVTLSEDGQHDNKDLNFNLIISNVGSEDAGVYHCYIVEFLESDKKRWTRSRAARLTVVDVLMSSVRCVHPNDKQISDSVSSEQLVRIGCIVHSNQEGTWLTLLSSDGSTLMESVTDNARVYNIKYSLPVLDLLSGRFTCIIRFRDEVNPNGMASRSCSMGPFVMTPLNHRTRLAVEVPYGTDAVLICPVRDGLQGFVATWVFIPAMHSSRLSISSDGSQATVYKMTDEDNGLLATCSLPNHIGTWQHVISVTVRGQLLGVTNSTSKNDSEINPVQPAGSRRDLVAPKQSVEQSLWRMLRGRASSYGKIRTHPRPDAIQRRIMDEVLSLPRTTIKPDLTAAVQITANLTILDVVNPASLPPMPDNSEAISPLIIVAMCEAGASLIVLCVAFAVLFQCCCHRKPNKSTGNKATHQETTPTLLTYKSTVIPDLASKPLPKIPSADEPIYTKPESILGTKIVLEPDDLPSTGSWVFSQPDTGNYETEGKPKEHAHEIYVTMV